MPIEMPAIELRVDPRTPLADSTARGSDDPPMTARPDLTPPLPEDNRITSGPVTAGPQDTSGLQPALRPAQQERLNAHAPLSIQRVLGRIGALIADGRSMPNPFVGPHDFVQVADHHFFSVRFRDLNEDNDGNTPPAIREQDPTSQRMTSLTQANGRPLNSVEDPFYVEPLGDFRRRVGTGVGDIAAFLRATPEGVFLAFAVCGDLGPENKWGEGSIALHRALGRNPIDDSGHLHDSALVSVIQGEPGLVAIVFEGTARLIDELKARGERIDTRHIVELGMQRFRELGGVPEAAIRIQGRAE
jgi:hypothetical protein